MSVPEAEAGRRQWNKVRILSFTRTYPNPGEPGLAPFVRARLQALAKLAEVKVMAPVPAVDYSNPQGRPLANWSVPGTWQDEGCEVLHPKWLFPPGGTPVNVACLAAACLPPLLRLKRRFPFDLIDSHFGYPDGAAARWLARATGVPYFVTLRGNEQLYARDPLRRGGLRRAIRAACGVISVSEQLRGLAMELGAPAERARTIPNGVDASVFHPRPREAARLRLELGNSELMILSAGGLGPGKGHHRIIRVLPQLLAQGLPVRLWIAGGANRDGLFRQEILALIGQLGVGGQVRMLGAVRPEELAWLMSACDVFCLASSSEGWPNVVHEALACGAPVVATRVGAIPQMLPSERYGIITGVDDEASLLAGLTAALARTWDRDAIQQWGQARSWALVGREVAEFLEERLKSQPR